MKQIPTFINALLIGILAFVLLNVVLPGANARAAQTPQPTASPQPVCDSSRTVSVSGTAVVNVVPDRALIQLGVQSNAATVDAVEAANTMAIRRVINAIQSLGVESKDIATDWYIIDPVYENYDSLYIKGYRIYNVVAITLREVHKTSSVIAAALKAGANQVVNVEFYTSELRKYRDQARELAMKAATEKAQALANAAGADAGCVLNISENTSSYYNGWWWYGSNRNQWTQNVVQNASPAGGDGALSEAGPVSLGQISVRAEVNVTLGLK
jgi:uncharacterized protein YggE